LQAGRCLAMGYVRGAAALETHQGTPVQIELWGEVLAARAWDA
jgi:4-methylaminobutanoate oxidase (formaldehyde-forming)